MPLSDIQIQRMAPSRFFQETQIGFPKLCAAEGCGKWIISSDEKWVKLTVMHQDRPGIGEATLCSIVCAVKFLTFEVA